MFVSPPSVMPVSAAVLVKRSVVLPPATASVTLESAPIVSASVNDSASRPSGSRHRPGGT